ncbi:MAG: hypothetical protein ACYDG2_24865 [Ruminiclostridium sp.]
MKRRILVSLLLYNIFLILVLHFFIDVSYSTSAIIGFTTSLVMLLFKIREYRKFNKK